MFNNIMRDPTVLFPLLVGLWLTCWTQGRWMEEISQMRIERRLRDRPVVPAVELGDWKPIDYGHPMRDPTLVYAPPVLDPVHYGIHSAEPLWPIKGHQLPPFSLPSEAVMEVAASNSLDQRHWMRLQPVFRPDDKDGPPLLNKNLLKSEVKTRPQMRVDNHVQEQAGGRPRWSPPIRAPLAAPSYQRYPVQATGWNGQQGGLTGRAPATIRPSLLAAYKPSSAEGSNYRAHYHNKDHERVTTSSSGNSIDRMDSPPLSSESEVKREDDEKEDESTAGNLSGGKNPNDKKRLRRPLFLNFFIQQGHSKVRKYGSQH